MDANTVITSYNGREIVTDEMEEENLRDNLTSIEESKSASLSDEFSGVNHSDIDFAVTRTSPSSYLTSAAPKTPIIDDHASSKEADVAFQIDDCSNSVHVSQTLSSVETIDAPTAATILEQQDDTSLSTEPILSKTTSNLSLSGEQPEELLPQQLCTFIEPQNSVQPIASSSWSDVLPGPQPLFKVKDVVAVEARVGRGMNKHGGVAFVKKVKRIEGRNCTLQINRKFRHQNLRSDKI